MVITYQVSEYPSLAEDLLAKVYESQSPDAEIASQTLPAPHDAPVEVIFPNLDRVTHIVKLIGATSGIIFGNYIAQPRENIVTIFDPIRFKVGDGGANTPAANSNTAVIPALIGFTINDFVLNRTGYGNLLPTTDYGFDTATGTIALTFPNVFSGEGTGDEYWIFRKQSSVSNLVNDSVVGKHYGGFVDIVAPTNYAASHLRKLIRLAGINAIYTFPVASAIPIGYHHCFTNFGAYADISDKPKIIFSNAALKWGNATITEIELPFTSSYAFTFDGTYWNVTSYNQLPPTAPFGIISYRGTKAIGNLSAPDVFVTVDIPDQGSTNYIAIGNLVGNTSDLNAENDAIATPSNYGKTATSFKLNIRALADQTEDFTYDFIIVKLN